MGEVAKLDRLFSWAFKQTYNSTYHGDEFYYHKAFNYAKILQKLRLLDYTAADLAYFTQNLLQKHEHHPKFSGAAGHVLSGLINACKSPDIVIFTETLTVKIDNLGVCNEKNLTVYGDVGKQFCAAMKKGNAVHYGDSGNRLALRMAGGTLVTYGSTGTDAALNLQGGDVVVNGRAGYQAGEQLEGGSLTINGDADGFVGQWMQKGIININGKTGHFILENAKGGDIFQFGRQIAKNGKIIAEPVNK
jgi:hypothetical protein